MRLAKSTSRRWLGEDLGADVVIATSAPDALQSCMTQAGYLRSSRAAQDRGYVSTPPGTLLCVQLTDSELGELMAAPGVRLQHVGAVGGPRPELAQHHRAVVAPRALGRLRLVPHQLAVLYQDVPATQSNII